MIKEMGGTQSKRIYLMNLTGFYGQRNGRDAVKTNLLNKPDGVLWSKKWEGGSQTNLLNEPDGFLWSKKWEGRSQNEST